MVSPPPHHKPTNAFANALQSDAIAEINSGADFTVQTTEFLGGYAEGVTPVPIPNTEVKPLRADGTAWVTVWESRSPPGILLKTLAPFVRGGRFALAALGSSETADKQ